MSAYIFTKNFFLWWQPLRSMFLATFNMQNTIINYSDHVIHYIPVTFLFHNGSIYLLSAFVNLTYYLLSTFSNHQSVLCIYELLLFRFRMWDIWYFSLSISLSIMPLMSIHVVTKVKISFFLWLNNIPFHICNTFPLSIHPLVKQVFSTSLRVYIILR